MIDRYWLTLALLGVLWAVAVGNIIGCNENKCASEVSKCQLIGSCGCSYHADNCTCCLNCSRCLAAYWEECCSCTGLCPVFGEDPIPSWHRSTLVDLDPFPSLFNALTSLEASQDPNLRWTSFPLTLKDQGILVLPTAMPTVYEDESPAVAAANTTVSDECIVAYMHDCTSLEKCQTTCRSMGAAQQRWFHNGCCECIGEICLNYGKNEPLCKECLAGEY
ncbi:twisted gastrulation protein homolog 1-A-like [Patiria miniata]|uniref:Twisted gastrulation n=1 Tax=Patiria miniata TaxID=46514 RepID=A0A914B354_PATMI|nr:twisted gastrulation protein homolog 1-A-like [Patiria miniata]XP_038070344.1 twisted gastrulation protein homolog 1-A-like [Patiria miniata]